MNSIAAKRSSRRGQSLIETVVALGIGIILIGGVTALIAVNTKRSAESKMAQIASPLTQEIINGVKSKAEADWNAFYALAKGSANKQYIASSTNAITAGTESVTAMGYSFSRYFYVENVMRTQCGIGTPTTTAATVSCNSNFPLGSADVAEDPSTQKIVVVVEWAGGRSIRQERYVSRTKNAAIRQTDWSGGGGDNSVLLSPNNKYESALGVDVTTSGILKVILTGGAGFDSGWLTSPIFDMGNNVAINAVIWKGLANGGAVRFQIAASTVSNPATWDYKGPDGTAVTTYTTGGADVSTILSPRDFSRVRFVRYKIFIDSNEGKTNSPEVRDVILSYSM